MLKFSRKVREFFPFISHVKHGFSLQKASVTLPRNIHRSINVVSSSVPLLKTRENGKTFRYKTSDSTGSIIGDRQLVYEGPLSRSVQLVKVFSLSTALATVVATPILMIYGKQSVPVIGKMAIGATILIAGTSTTFLLHWMTKVYVHKMFYNAMTETFVVETMSMLARRKETEFKLNEIKLAKEPTAFTTFQAQGKKYFLHTDLLEAQQVLQFIRENRT